MDDRGCLLPAGETGEIVVRGGSVMQGYDNDPEANGRPLHRAGSGQATRAFWMPMAICSSRGASRRSSTVAGKKSPRGKWTTCSWTILQWPKR